MSSGSAHFNWWGLGIHITYWCCGREVDSRGSSIHNRRLVRCEAWIWCAVWGGGRDGGWDGCWGTTEVCSRNNVVTAQFGTSIFYYYCIICPPPSRARTPTCRPLTLIAFQFEAVGRQMVNLPLAIRAQFLWPSAASSPIAASPAVASTPVRQQSFESQ